MTALLETLTLHPVPEQEVYDGDDSEDLNDEVSAIQNSSPSLSPPLRQELQKANLYEYDSKQGGWGFGNKLLHR